MSQNGIHKYNILIIIYNSRVSQSGVRETLLFREGSAGGSGVGMVRSCLVGMPTTSVYH